jgi:hypothetical protein
MTSKLRPLVNNGHCFWSQGWSLYTGLTVHWLVFQILTSISTNCFALKSRKYLLLLIQSIFMHIQSHSLLKSLFKKWISDQPGRSWLSAIQLCHEDAPQPYLHDRQGEGGLRHPLHVPRRLRHECRCLGKQTTSLKFLN